MRPLGARKRWRLEQEEARGSDTPEPHSGGSQQAESTLPWYQNQCYVGMQWFFRAEHLGDEPESSSNSPSCGPCGPKEILLLIISWQWLVLWFSSSVHRVQAMVGPAWLQGWTWLGQWWHKVRHGVEKLLTGGLGSLMKVPQHLGKLSAFVYTVGWDITYR